MAKAKKLLPLLGILLCLGVAQLRAQDEETAEQKQYREDYEVYQKIAAIKEPLKRADEVLKFMQERPKSQIAPFAQADYLFIIQDIAKQTKWDSVLQLSERMVKLKPKVGETYYFLGQALNEQKKYPEAIDALARCYVIKNEASTRAKSFLDLVYRRTHKGSLDGLDELIRKVRQEVGD